jgi:hypothetical protein
MHARPPLALATLARPKGIVQRLDVNQNNAAKGGFV